MIRKTLTFFILMAALCALPLALAAQDGSAKPTYTLAEYDAYKACEGETNPQARVKCLDSFVSAYPASTLLPYAFRIYYTTYAQLKDSNKKVVEYADKMLALGTEKVDASTRLEAAYTGTTHFYGAYNAKAPEAEKSKDLNAALSRARTGLEIVGGLKKPESVTDEQFAANLKQLRAIFHHAVGYASLELKDYAGAKAGFTSTLENNPADGLAYFRMGVAHLQSTPPEHLDGFWALAKSVSLKGPGEAQVRRYLRNQLVAYQQPSCEVSIDPQMNELLALAGGTATRPEGYSIPAAAELDKARADVATFIADLKGGGDKAKITWLALCNSEFPELGGKVFEVSEAGDTVVVKLYIGPSQEEIEASTEPNSELKITGQPEAKRLKKDGLLKFSGTLSGYEPEPFLLSWDKVKVEAEFIPAEEAPAKAPTKRPAKRPAKRPPAR